jgi:hypothetical protein
MGRNHFLRLNARTHQAIGGQSDTKASRGSWQLDGLLSARLPTKEPVKSKVGATPPEITQGVPGQWRPYSSENPFAALASPPTPRRRRAYRTLTSAVAAPR